MKNYWIDNRRKEFIAQRAEDLLEFHNAWSPSPMTLSQFMNMELKDQMDELMDYYAMILSPQDQASIMEYLSINEEAPEEQ